MVDSQTKVPPVTCGATLADARYADPFTALRLLPILTTSTADLVQDFFQPLLLRSVSYDRGVGFFSAGWLRINAIGLAALVRNGGRARWVTSPILSQEEWEALRTGVTAADHPPLCQSLQRSLDDIEISLTTETLSTLAWMVAEAIEKGLVMGKTAVRKLRENSRSGQTTPAASASCPNTPFYIYAKQPPGSDTLQREVKSSQLGQVNSSSSSTSFFTS